MSGIIEYKLTTNRGPYGGVCTIFPPSGTVAITNFVITCANWQSTLGALTYRTFIKEEEGNYRLLKYGSKETLDVSLPSTTASSSNRVELKIEIIDLYGTHESVMLDVQVLFRLFPLNPIGKFTPLHTPCTNANIDTPCTIGLT